MTGAPPKDGEPRPRKRTVHLSSKPKTEEIPSDVTASNRSHAQPRNSIMMTLPTLRVILPSDIGSPTPPTHLPSDSPTTSTNASTDPATMSERLSPLPKPLYYTTLATLGLSTPVLVLAFVDLGTVSFFLNIPAAGLTILHDATLLRMAARAARYRPAVVTTPGYFDPAASGFNLCVLAACALMYFLGFGMTVFTGVFAQRGDISWETGTGMGTIVAQAVLAPLVGTLLLVALFQSVRMRKLGGPHLYGQF